MSGGFSHLSVCGYRRLRDVDLTIRPLNVLIGANGVGKSSLLDVFSLLAASADGTLESCISDYGGMSGILSADGECKRVVLKLSQEPSSANTVSSAPLDYELVLLRENYGYVIASEKLTQQRLATAPRPFKYIDSSGSQIRYHVDGSLVRPNWEHKPLETSLAQVPKMYQIAESFRQLLGSVSPIYHSLDVSHRAPVRMPQPLISATMPGNDGEDLLSCLFTMRETDRDRYDVVEDSLRGVFPAFDKLEFLPASGGVLTLGWRERGLSRAISANELSEGTLRFLWLVTLLQSPGLPRVTLIDEPEVSLHPDMLRMLADLMRESATRSQIIVATHSDRFVRFLESSELVLCNQDESGWMTAKRASDLDLTDWLKQYSLDELWMMGRLGARP